MGAGVEASARPDVRASVADPVPHRPHFWKFDADVAADAEAVALAASGAFPRVGKEAAPEMRIEAARGPERIQVSAYLTPEQYAIFAPAAENSKATVGEVLLALACDCLCDNPCADDPVEQLESALWSYATGRWVPKVEKRWREAKFLVSQPADNSILPQPSEAP